MKVKRFFRIIVQTVLMLFGTIAYGQGPVRIGKTVIPYVNDDFGSVNIDYQYTVNNQCVIIKVTQLVVGMSNSLDGELKNELRKRHILPHTQQSGVGISFQLEGTVDFSLHLKGTKLTISGYYSGSSGYYCFNPTEEIQAYASEYSKKNNKNFYVSEASMPLPIQVTDFTFSDLSAKIDQVKRELKASRQEKKEEQERQRSDFSNAAPLQNSANNYSSANAQTATNAPSGANATTASGNHASSNRPAPLYADPELNKKVEEQQRQMEARQRQIADMKRQMREKQRQAEALESASEETFTQWQQGNYLEGAQPLANEYARQGDAAGAYGTIAVAAGAQIASWAKAAKQRKEAAERRQMEEERIRKEKEERERQMKEERERLEREAFELLISQRHTILETFSTSDPIPLSTSKIETDRIYYFIYAADPQTINQKKTTIYVSNAFEIAKYKDGTWPYQSRIDGEIKTLTPYFPITHGFYFSMEDAENMRNEFIASFQANEGVAIIEVEYLGKPAESSNPTGPGSTAPSGNGLGIPLGTPVGDQKTDPAAKQSPKQNNLGIPIKSDR